MSDTSKRKVNAKRIADDICSGMSDDDLKRKYALSGQQLQVVKKKLASLGLAPQPTAFNGKVAASKQIPRVTPASQKKTRFSSSDSDAKDPRHQPSPPPGPQKRCEWICPACGLRQSQQYDECPKCGIVVAKLDTLGQAGPYGTIWADRSIKEKEPVSSTGWGIVAIGVAALIIVGIAMFKWSSPGKDPAGISESTGGVSKRPTTVPGAAKYETGFVKDFTVQSFEHEVVAASRECPVLVEFYSDT